MTTAAVCDCFMRRNLVMVWACLSALVNPAGDRLNACTMVPFLHFASAAIASLLHACLICSVVICYFVLWSQQYHLYIGLSVFLVDDKRLNSPPPRHFSKLPTRGLKKYDYNLKKKMEKMYSSVALSETHNVMSNYGNQLRWRHKTWNLNGFQTNSSVLCDY